MSDPHVDDKTKTAASCNNVEVGESRKRKQAQVLEVNENAKLQEYLEVMQVPSRSKIWANDESIKTSTIYDLLTEKSAVLSTEGEYDHAQKKPKKFSGSETVMETPYAVNEKTGMTSSLPDSNRTADDGSPPPNNNALVASDQDWLRLRTSRLLGLGDDESNAQDPKISNCQYETTMPEGLINSQKSAEKTTFDASITKKGHADGTLTDKDLLSTLVRLTDVATQATGRLFVRNLSYKVTENELRMHFENEGQTPVEGVRIFCVQFFKYSHYHVSGDEHPDRDILCYTGDVNRKSILVDTAFSEDDDLFP